MAERVLVDPLIEDGHRLLVDLVRGGVDVSLAMWVLHRDGSRWLLYIGAAAAAPDQFAAAYRTLHDCMGRHPGSWVTPSVVHLLLATDPVVAAAIAIRDRYPGGRLATRFGGDRLGPLDIDGAYIYPRITAGLTREEVLQTVTALLGRPDPVRSSLISLRDGSVFRGVPYGLEAAPAAGIDVKIRDDSDGRTRVVPADEVVNIQ